MAWRRRLDRRWPTLDDWFRAGGYRTFNRDPAGSRHRRGRGQDLPPVRLEQPAAHSEPQRESADSPGQDLATTP